MLAPNLQDFGGVGDGVTLNDAAIAAWLSAAAIYGAGYAPGGQYLSTNGLRSVANGLLLHGDGMWATKFQTNNLRGLVDGFAAVGGPGQGNAIILEDMAFMAPLGVITGSNGIAIINNSRAIVRRVAVNGFSTGVYVANSFATIIEECYLTNMLGAAMSYAPDNSANSSSFNRNSVFACGGAQGSWAILNPGSYGTWTANENDVEGCAGGFLLSSPAGFKPCLNGNWAERNPAGNYSGPVYSGTNYGF